MDRHAGFAAAVAMGEGALADLAKVLYHAGGIAHRLSGTSPALGTIPSVALNDMFLSPPKFVLRQAHPGRIGLELHGWGDVTVDATTRAPETRGAFFDAVVLLEARSVLVKGRLAITVDPATALLDVLGIHGFPGDEFSPAAQADLDSPALKALMELGLRIALAQRGPLFPPFDVSFLGAVASDPGTRAKLVVVDGALVLGLDANVPGVLVTTGDPTKLTNFLGRADIGVWTNPLAVSVAFASVKDGLSSSVMAQGGTLDAFSIAVEEGDFAITGTASKTDPDLGYLGAVNFSVKAAPVLERSGDPARDRLRFGLRDLVVDVNPVWWAVAAEVLFPPAFFLVDFFVSFVRTNVINGIQVQGPTDAGSATQTFTLPGVSEPNIAIQIMAFECHTEGVFVGLFLRADFRPASVHGPEIVSADEVPTLTAHPVRFVIDPAFTAAKDDPRLRVRWSVLDPAGAELLVADQSVSSGAFDLVLGKASLPWLTVASYRVDCRLYRVLGSLADTIVQRRLPLRVADRLDRTHPYVHWTHRVQVPVVAVESDGSRTILGSALKTRHSKIHRTDIPGRCISASRYSPYWSEFTYLDALPFPRADLAAHRAQVCDYCFFGGPTKSTPLIP